MRHRDLNATEQVRERVLEAQRDRNATNAKCSDDRRHVDIEAHISDETDRDTPYHDSYDIHHDRSLRKGYTLKRKQALYRLYGNMTQHCHHQHNNRRDKDPSQQVRVSDMCHEIRKLFHCYVHRFLSIPTRPSAAAVSRSSETKLLLRGILVYSLTVVPF